MEVSETFYANIYIGLREQYSSIYHRFEEVQKILEEYCYTVGLCVTITPTYFAYSKTRGIDGFVYGENGVIVGLINYPRFPASKEDILKKAFEIAKIFLVAFNQFRISIVCPDNTYMLDQNDLDKNP